MRSTAQFKGHPLHAMLIPFPFAFLTGAFAFDVAGWLTASPAWWTTGGHLAAAGVVAALVAAIPGFIDYLNTVPPGSSGKRRATKHMAVNLTSVGLFALCWLLRGSAGSPPTPGVLGLEFVALCLLSAGGYMGGTLVYRNQIGIDHRYAHAGKWQETVLSPAPGQPLVAGRTGDLKVNQMKLLHIADRENRGNLRIVLGRTEKGYVAFDDFCTHRGGSLADGALICGIVQCPWHGSQFETGTGRVVAGPAAKDIGVYSVKERDGEITIEL
jgi:uncharacterized membrane protein/nitrite reductase/ring-hydroxylating ferredoxin subunit